MISRQASSKPVLARLPRRASAGFLIAVVLLGLGGCLQEADDKDYDFDNPNDSTPGGGGDDETGSLVIAFVSGDTDAVVIVNQSATDEDMTSWSLQNEDGTASYSFPEFELNNGAVVRLHTETGTDDADDLYGHGIDWGPVGSEQASLYDDSGNLVDSCSEGDPCWP